MPFKEQALEMLFNLFRDNHCSILGIKCAKCCNQQQIHFRLIRLTTSFGAERRHAITITVQLHLFLVQMEQDSRQRFMQIEAFLFQKSACAGSECEF